MRMIDGEGLSPDILFVALANADGVVGIDELQRWRELQEMITDGDVLESELLDVYNSVTKSGMDLTKLEVDGFVELYTAINNLFEEDGDDGTITTTDDEMQQPVTHKIELLDAIADLGRANELPCGLDATELEQREILSIVELLENDSTNMIRSQQGIIAPQELSGEWELIYSSSSAMKFNQGLTGLGGSVPNGQFSTLKQKLISTKFLSDVEYNERIEMNPSSASFDVTVTGTWDLRTSVSLFTGEPSIVMNVVPDRVTYGPTSTRADHWKSLGPMNMLDISYLDDNLRIMRGNTSIDTIFVFRRIAPSNR
jgi:PAP_fibrillin